MYTFSIPTFGSLYAAALGAGTAGELKMLCVRPFIDIHKCKMLMDKVHTRMYFVRGSPK